MHSAIKLLSIDFDGTLVSRVSEPVLDTQCMELIRELQRAGAIWAINTGRSVDLLESGLADFAFPAMEINGNRLATGMSAAPAITPSCSLQRTRFSQKLWIS